MTQLSQAQEAVVLENLDYKDKVRQNLERKMHTYKLETQLQSLNSPAPPNWFV